MSKRSFFLTIGWTSWILLIIAAFTPQIIWDFKSSLVVSICLLILLVLFSIIIPSILIEKSIIFTISPIKSNFKRIYSSGYGDFYIRIKDYRKKYGHNTNLEIDLYNQGYFKLTYINTYSLDGSMDQLISEIKKYVDLMEESYKEDRHRLNTLKSWDGFLDNSSRRDNIINKIIK